MSRTVILAIVIAAIGAGGYYYLNQSETTPTEALETAAQDAGDAVTDAATTAEDTVADAVDTATEAASDAASSLADQASEAASSVVDQASEAASSVADQASEAASSVADQASDAAEQAGEQVAALAGQGQELLSSWIADGKLNPANFDYEGVMASLQESTLAEGLKEQAIKIVNDIKDSPETVVQKIQELTKLLTQQ